jgi:arginine-tRNA-protein transferase
MEFMILHQSVKRSDISQCHYLPDRQWRFEYFYASGLSGEELGRLLEKGWRKFGLYFFRPICPACRACIPIRVLVDEFIPSRSQRRILRRNSDCEVRFGPLQYSDRIYEIYADHSVKRFGRQDTHPEEFMASFFTRSCPSLQSEYHVENSLAGVGFIDRSTDALSSVYFIYDTEYEHLGLGTFSVIREIGYARDLGLKYYYLGYYIPECMKMAYKGRFRPYEFYDWGKGRWALSPA